MVAGCAGVRQTLVREAAAGDHECPLDRVTLVRETTTAAQGSSRRWQYDLLVCSVRRVYRYDPELEVFREASTFEVASTAGGASTSSGGQFSEFRRGQQRQREREAAVVEAEQPRFDVGEDEFTGEVNARFRTGVAWEAGERNGPTFLSLVVNPSTMTGRIAVSTTFDRLRWRQCHAFNMLAGDERLPLSQATHDGVDQSVEGQPRVQETVTAQLGATAVRALLNAESVRGRVCSDVFAFRPEGIAGLHEFRARLADHGTAAPAGRPAQ